MNPWDCYGDSSAEKSQRNLITRVEKMHLSYKQLKKLARLYFLTITLDFDTEATVSDKLEQEFQQLWATAFYQKSGYHKLTYPRSPFLRLTQTIIWYTTS